MARGKGEYVKGTTVQVLATDGNGFPTDSIERDADGQLWHVSGDSDPVQVRDDEEVRAVAAEGSNRRGSGGDEFNG